MLGQVALRLRLGQRVKRREDVQPAHLQLVGRVIARQLATHDVDERRKIAGGTVEPAGHGDRRGDRGVAARRVDQRRVGHHAENAVAPLAHALREPLRLVIRRPAHDRHQHRDLCGVQLAERAREIVLAGEPEAVDCARAILAEVDLVDVGGEDLVLRIAQLQQHGHDRLAELAPEAALVGQEIALDELLRQRAAALADAAGTDVGDRRTQHGTHIDAEVAVEAPVLDQSQRVAQQRRNGIGRQYLAILAVRGEDAADDERIEAQHGQRIAAVFAQRADGAAVERQPHTLRRLLPVPEHRRTPEHVEYGAAAPVLSGAGHVANTCVAKLAQVLFELIRAQRRAGIELQRLCMHARRQVPAPRLERARDAQVQ